MKTIDSRIRYAFLFIAPNPTARYNVIAEKTGIARTVWVNWINGRQSLSVEMLEAFIENWNEFAEWVVFYRGLSPRDIIVGEFEYVVAEIKNGVVESNIPHVVSYYEKGVPPDFYFGVDCPGVKEFATNILYCFGVKFHAAKHFAKYLALEFLIAKEGNSVSISGSDIRNWIKVRHGEMSDFLKYYDKARSDIKGARIKILSLK